MENLGKKLKDWQKNASKTGSFSFITKLFKKFPPAEIYLVGGAVRDLLLKRETKDFDFVVAKVPAEDLEKFLSREGKVDLVGKSFGVFKFAPEKNKIDPIDIALPRTEQADMTGGYRDFEVQSDKDLPIEKDLSRRDFTINALAWDLKNRKLIDKFNGLEDLKGGIIKAIGDPKKRFQEDYTRMLRAIRFFAQLDFNIEAHTLKTIADKKEKIADLPKERIGEEFVKIIMSGKAEEAVRLMQALGLLKILIPELDAGAGLTQNKAHIYDVFEHSVRALGAAALRDFSLEVRLAALLHDVGKPITKEGNGPDATFYNHDQVGARIAKNILKRLNFPSETVKKTVHLVRYHMFYYALDIVTDAGVRRLLNRLGKENIDDFISIRICDRLGMGRPKAKPWKLIELERRLKEVQLDPITPKMLKINGGEIMEILKLKPGPRIGLILNALLGEILEDPGKNAKKHLAERILSLNELPAEKLKQLHPDIKYHEEERKRLLHREK